MSVKRLNKQDNEVIDPESRTRRLLDQSENTLQNRFLRGINSVGESISLDELEELIRFGRINEFFEQITLFATGLATAINDVRLNAGRDTSEFLTTRAGVIADFDSASDRIVDLMNRNRLALVRGLTNEQRQVINQVIQNGFRDGNNPRETARRLRASIGLTPRQLDAVDNFEQALRNRDSAALRRQLRDRRFDPTIRASIRDKKDLTDAQINRIVDRYRERYIAFRAETISRTESLNAVHQGVFESYEQAFDSGQLQRDQIQRSWHTAGDGRVRDSHGSMNNQKRRANEPFVSGLGNQLQHPGDQSAPAADTIQCRCAVSTRIVNL